MQRRGTSGVQLRTDGLGNALFDETKQVRFDVVAGELERELLGAFTVTAIDDESKFTELR
jgi:hypothetical protein